ncbi:MAG: carbohydrate kinase [Spirochaetes bacterium RBG_13_51_14]|nr:MAG: carbohydrate kinase [Spirochaetes bacterium RBG_13_51_14]
MAEAFVVTHDVGTTGNKSCIYRISERIDLIDSCLVEYPLYTTPDRGVEQKTDEWWSAICGATKIIMARSGVVPARIKAMTFCAQMQGSVLVDEEGRALRNPMIYLDGRSAEQIARYLFNGLIKIDGKWNARTAIESLRITGGLAATPKDPLWKYHWVKDNEPDLFKRTYKWLDVKDYLILRCTGRYGMTRDSAHLTFLYDTRPGKLGWHRGLCKKFDVNMDHLPPVVDSTDVVGHLLPAPAAQMGLVEGIPIFGGGGDTSLTTIGAGCLDRYDTHVYIGTSGWIISNVDTRMVDIANFIASILGAIPGFYNYTAEQETSGACLKWARDHLALDDIGMYGESQHMVDKTQEYETLFDFMNRVVSETPPGAGNVLFTPWLHGNRSPREDSHARGMFFNLSLDTGKREMIRSVLEGIAFHKRWMLEAMERKIPHRERLRFVGGGAKSDVGCQIMADITGRVIETTEDPQNAGAKGATVACAVGLGLLASFSDAKELIPVKSTYEPRTRYRELYDKNFEIFKKLYERNKALFSILNSRAG